MTHTRKQKGGLSSWLALLLAVAMLAGSLPAAAFEVKAAGETEEAGVEAQSAGEQTTFQHPGLLHSEESFTKMKENVDNNVSPNKETWDALWWDGYSDANWNPRPLEYVYRGGTDNVNQFRIDVRRAYQNALIWRISGDEAHGEAACRIINAWTATMKGLGGNADRFLAAGIQGYELANIGEIMRDHPNFDTEGLQNLLLNIFYPMNDDFMRRHNDAYIGNYWANWELCNIASMISIGVFCDREDIYEQALDYFMTGKGNGSFYHTMPYVFEEEGLVQWQESVRDQGHTNLGIVLCEVIMETAWNQGDDLYSLSDNRFLKAVEYTAKYNSLNEDVPSAAYEYRSGKNGASSWYDGVNPYQRGNWRPMYSLAYNHYVNRMGLEMPNVKRMMDASESYIEGAPGTSFDEMGWQTLTFANISERIEDVPVEGELSDGVYRICSASSGKSLVVNDEGNLASAEKGTRKDEWWLFQNKGDGEYTITNMVTGKVMQVNSDDDDESDSEYYAYGTQIGTGDANGSLSQSFAFLKENTGEFRIVPSLSFLVLALENNSTADDARIVQWRNDAWGSYWNDNNPGQRWTVEKATEVGTEFTFDDESTGFSTTYAEAEGSYTLTDHGNGKAVSLNGTSDFLNVQAKTEKSVLAGEKAFTVSFEAKPEAGSTNWMFYAAPSGETQTEGQENYLGIKEENGTITAEQCKGGTVVSASAAVGADGWYQVSVVYDGAEMILYINGEEKARQTGGYDISDILGENSILQIGKANLGNGEYYKGLLDNFKINGHVMTSGEVLSEAADYAQVTVPETLIDFTFDDVQTGLTGGVATAKGVYSLQDHDGGKALYLNGYKDFLKVTGQDGGTLVPGGLVKELTISLQVKMEGGTGWVFYAAPDTTSQTYLWENYLGVLDSNGTVTAQRFANKGVTRSNAAETASQANCWHYLTVVLTEQEIIVYDNGEEKARVTNETPLSEILGGDSIWQIGKANWGKGEYFQGLIDNYKVVSRAWTPEEVKTEALKYVDKSALQSAVDAQWAGQENEYSAERWTTYTTALETAEKVLADEQALQSAVDSAEEDLNNVQSWMRLDEALNISVAETQKTEYTAKTWEPYAAALATAKELQEGGTAARADVNAATKALTKTQSALILKGETIEEAISRIAAIGEVQLTPDCSRKVILARQTCDLLDEEELAEVTNLSTLEAAEAAMTTYLAEFTFDNEETGFIGGQAVAEGAYTIQNGMIYLDGSSTNWLNVTKGDGSSLLTGQTELTISFGAKPETGSANWMFYAAPNGDAPTYNYETYLAAWESSGTLIAERYANNGERADTANTGIDNSDWYYVTVVCTAEETILYVNGEEKARQASSVALTDIFGENSILQIGKANWGTGEYYKGYLDNFKIMGTVMSAEEIKAEAENYLDNIVIQEDVTDVIEKINAIGTVTVSVDCRTKIAQARTAYDALTSAEKALITNADLLTSAEKTYEELFESYKSVVGIAFDENGITSSGLTVTANGTPEIVEDEERGQALSLDGTGSVWLSVANEDGTPLLSGVEELTISYYSKAGRSETNWAFYAAPNETAQTYNSEYYIGIFENSGSVTAERFLNGRQPSASAEYEEGWNHIVVVYHADCTKVYVNGFLTATAENSGSLKEILGDDSVLQIGKANWGTGEYYQGLLDDIEIYNYTLAEEEIKALDNIPVVDTKALTDRIAEAKSIEKGNYTEESYDALQTAIATAEAAVHTVTTVEEVTEAVNALQGAIEALEEKEADPSVDTKALTDKIAEAMAIEKDNYTEESYAALQSAIREANAAVNTVTTEDEVTEAVNALQSAIDALEVVAVSVDTSALTDKITEAMAIEKGNYTEESYEALQSAIAAAEAAIDTVTTAEEVTEAVNALQAAIDGLKEKEKDPQAVLTDKIDEAVAIEKGNYTEESYAALQAAIEKAKEVLNTAATDEEITEALNALQAALDALKEKEPQAMLTEKITEAIAVEKDEYTEESYAALQSAIEKAQEVLNTAATDEEITEALNALQAALDALVKKTNSGNPGGTTNPEITLVESITLMPKNRTLTVGQSFTVTVTVSPADAENKEVELTSSNPKVAVISGTKVIAKGAGSAVITAKAKDSSGVTAALQVKVCLQTTAKVKAAQQKTSRNVKVTFGKVAGATGYDVYRSTKAKTGYKKIGTTKKTSYVDKKVKNGKTYYYKIVAKAGNTAYNSTPSIKYAKIKVLARPSVKVKAAGAGKVKVTWKKIKGAKGYVVYTSTKKNKGFKAVKTVNKAKTVKAVIKAKKNAKKLYVKVRPFYKQNGKKVYGPYSKTIAVKVKR